MKEINGQLYGYSYELDSTTEADLTTCYAVDTGTIFVAFGGVWYEQPSFWAAQLSPSASDEYGYSYELGRRVADADLQIFNALDTGDRYVSFNGRWYKQPIAWSAPASGGGGGGGGGGSGVLVVHESYDSATSTWTMDTVASEIWSAMQTGLAIVVSDISSSVIANAQYIPEESEEYYFVICDNDGPGVYSAANGDDYPARVMS